MRLTLSTRPAAVGARDGSSPGPEAFNPQQVRKTVGKTRSDIPLELRAPGREDASQDSGLFSLEDLDESTLGLLVGCSAAAILLVLVAVLLFWIRRRRRRKSLDSGLDDVSNDGLTKSAPSSRTPSPSLPKRLSCPDALQFPKKGLLVRSMTVDRIPDFTLPERVQPRSGPERVGSMTSLQYQQSLIGSLQPDLYRYSQAMSKFLIGSHNSSMSEDEEAYLPMSTHGRLWYSLVYDAAVEQLTVTLIKVKDLPGESVATFAHNGSNPLCQAPSPSDLVRYPYLPLTFPILVFHAQGEARVFIHEILMSSCSFSLTTRLIGPLSSQKDTFITLRDQVGANEVKSRVLRFSVYDVDKRKVRHSLGHVMVPLKEVDFTHADTYWADLEPTAQTSASLGELQVSLCYLPQVEKIKLGIIRARGLKHADMDAETGVYLRVHLCYGRKVYRSKRTSTRPGALDVEINEMLSFSVSGKQMDSCRLELALMVSSARSGVLSHDTEYGRAVIGPFMYARGEELLHWQEMLAQPRVAILRSHALVACSQP
ncbi:hypothetical protein C0Q70_02249 [Pomacea canaliculata]|uniref:C2 domain-containing protein n=1 Tax=Pomacea canaliculata TaxID=400727 RepID=A0A2T7Q1S4_POMCA|nr:hypothetical protein C0Q70_02249 [Pomacea canaliculata]